MAQNRKASDEDVRKTLREALGTASKEMATATEAYTKDGSLANLRKVQVATDRLAKLNSELRRFESARSIDATRQADTNPRRAKNSWPVGKPYDDPRRQKPVSRTPVAPPKEKPQLPPPPAPRPPVLSDRRSGDEHVSWWVGADRSKMATGAKALEKLVPSKTSVVPSKQTIQKEQQKQNEAKREAGRSAAGQLQDRLKPTAGDFSVIPLAE